ncbi:hypothetical protein [Butyrivibrio sp. WCD3002]|uniref:hypothetical protein n=1 Tax=Butyrivibrio sp. WCD3002 TaxID=1280676 RepID=UPI0004052238|nr:hypothetical protein [Butyrivibrio sp. WCD3002]
MVNGDFWKEVSKSWVTKSNGVTRQVEETAKSITKESKEYSDKLMKEMNSYNDKELSDLLGM